MFLFPLLQFCLPPPRTMGQQFVGGIPRRRCWKARLWNPVFASSSTLEKHFSFCVIISHGPGRKNNRQKNRPNLMGLPEMAEEQAL